MCAFLAGIWSLEAATWAIALVTLLLVLAAFSQLKEIREGQRGWATMEACNKYDLDPVLRKRIEKIINWIELDSPKRAEVNYSEIRNATFVMLNYFEGIAIGYYQNQFDQIIIKSYLGSLIACWGYGIFKDPRGFIWEDRNKFQSSYSNFIKLSEEFRSQMDHSIFDQ